MDTLKEVEAYLASQPEPKQGELRELHQHVMRAFPTAELWFNDGKNHEGKTVANPTIGYGRYTIEYADGSTKEFYRVGLSANTIGISVYILGLDDKTYLARTFGPTLGKASVTGYCIKFKTLKNLNVATLHSAIRFGLTPSEEVSPQDRTQGVGVHR